MYYLLILGPVRDFTILFFFFRCLAHAGAWLGTDLSSAVGVDGIELCGHVLDGSDPLLDGRLHRVGAELLLGDAVVVAGVDPVNEKSNEVGIFVTELKVGTEADVFLLYYG